LRCIECNDEKKKTGQNWGATTGNTIVGETVEIAGEKQDVVPDVETSLGQQDVELDAEKSTEDIEPNAEVHVAEDKRKSHESGEASDEEDTVEKEDNNVVDLDEEDSLEVPLPKTYGPSIAKRLRSSTSKPVPTPTKTPKTRMKSVVVGPKKGWSKVTPKVTTEKKSKKRKDVESSDSEYVDVFCSDVLPNV
jgi:hypothetical protein